MNKRAPISRRTFLTVALSAAAGAVATACGATPTPTPIPPTATKPPAAPTAAPAAPTATKPAAAPTTAPAAPTAAPAAPTATAAPATGKYKEAPALADLVKSGKLPSVEQRLPANPMIIKPVEAVGVYGGSWKIFLDAVTRVGDLGDFNGLGLLKWNRAQNSSEGCVAESWEVKESGKQFIVHLRKGLKWSDGEPLNADDVMFWWEDIQGNKELSPVIVYWMYSATKTLGTVAKIDDTTISFTFDKPHGLFVTYITKELRAFAPKHYLKNFHVKYVAKEELDKKAQEKKLANWVALFQNRNGSQPDTYGMSNPELPTWFPWANSVEPPAERFVYKRNPYFFGVDTAGNQLPYIDDIDARVVQADVVNLKIIAGEPNFQVSRAQAFKDLPLYMQYADKNEYNIYQWGDLQQSEAAIWINQTTPDPVDRKIFQDKRFRIAMSVAIDRERINQTLYSGLGKPTAATLPIVESKIYKDSYAKAYTQYDKAMANKLLDEMGLDKKGADGIRLKPDGKPCSFVVEVPNDRLGMIDNFNMMKDDYKAVGIDFVIKPQANTLWTQRNEGSLMQMVGWPMGKSASETDLVPISTGVDWAPLWGLWYNTVGKQGEEPPAEVKAIQDAWSEILSTTDEKRQIELYGKILQSNADNVWVIGVVGPVPKPIVVKKWFHGVSKEGTWSFHHGHFIGWSDPCQFYIEKSKQ